MAMEWNASLRTGVDEIDEQHKELFRQANNLNAAMSQGKGRDEVGRLLDFLGKYVIDHFAQEEALMARWRCSMAEANKQAHRQFVARFNELRKQSGEGANASVVIDIYNELTQWLVQHIRGIDAKLATYVDAQKALVGAK